MHGTTSLKFNHLSPSSTEVKNEWSYSSDLPVCLRSAHREKFTSYHKRHCSKPFLYFSNTQYQMNQDFFVGTLILLRTGYSRNRYSVPSRGKKWFFQILQTGRVNNG